MSDKIKSCYMDDQPKLKDTKVFVDDVHIATVRIMTLADQYELIPYFKKDTGMVPLSVLVPMFVTWWASDLPITKESLLTLKAEFQNAIVKELLNVWQSPEQSGISKNLETPLD